MGKLMTVHESEWNKLEAEIKRLEKLVDDIAYTAKNRKEKMHLYREQRETMYWSGWSDCNELGYKNCNGETLRKAFDELKGSKNED